ncbi:MAG TPA: RluA family pseudouridine synthase [Thermodesulfobacteriota bacterium]|nr:RluA family pseudouridine synthase [Thermodesulfobacteriota bacterium]
MKTDRQLAMKEGRRETFQIPSDFSGKRADVVFSSLLPGLTRSQVRRLIDDGFILIEGKPIKPSKKVTGGETVSVVLPPPEPLLAEPEDIPLDILYEDDDIVVVNKPAGMTVHPGAGIKRGTLVNALLFRCGGLSGIGGKIRPGIVHRLDKDTSGVMVVAKNDFTHQALVNQFNSRRVEKRYIALVLGNVKGECGSFSSPIGRHPTNRVRMSTRAKTGKEALTLWRVIKRYGEVTMVEAEPKTGRTHQIRVHFAENGYPLLGDRVYGSRKYGSHLLEEVSKCLGRQALHASKIGFIHPRSGRFLEFYAPIPDDMKRVIDLLEEQTGAGDGLD